MTRSPSIALGLLLTLAPPGRPCGPPSVVVAAAGSGSRLTLSPGAGFRQAAAATGRDWTELFRAYRRGHHVRQVDCPEAPGGRAAQLEVLVGGAVPVRSSFFRRMPLDRWHTPADGTWGVSRSGGSRRHKGIDMHAPEGDPVYAVAPGWVYRAWTDKGVPLDGGYGNYVILEHEDSEASGLRYWTYYTHMKDPPQVTEGDWVPAGFLVGTVGRTPIGRFENPHLHFEVRLADGSELGVAMNPTPFGPFRARFTGGEGAF